MSWPSLIYIDFTRGDGIRAQPNPQLGLRVKECGWGMCLLRLRHKVGLPFEQLPPANLKANTFVNRIGNTFPLKNTP